MISAYLSIFDDWQLLGPAMASIEPLVDEIVVVDGAYQWVAPHLPAGRDPARSDPRVRDALAPFAAKTRFIEGVWRDEMEKRTAGYAACRGRWILKADADEIVFPTDAWSGVLDGRRAVGQTEMLNYVAPGWIEGQAPAPRQGVLFDAGRISALEHLSYAWLVYPGSPGGPEVPAADATLIAPEPIARHAHLTHWRPPETAANRARYYILNLHRRTGRSLPAIPLHEHVLRSSLVNEIDTDGDFSVRPTPLATTEEAQFAALYAPYMQGLRELAASLHDWKPVAAMRRGVTRVDRPPVVLDITDTPTGDRLVLEFREPPTSVEARAHWIFTDAPWVEREAVQTEVQGTTVVATVPPKRPWLRRSFRLWFESAEPQWLRVRGV